jgi:MFS family permease
MALFLITNYLLYFLKDTFDSFRIGPIDLREEGRAAQVLAIAVSLFGALGAVIGARVVDKAGSRRMVLASGFVIATVLVPFALAREFYWLILLAVPFGIGSGLRASADTALATMTLTDLRESGAQMGLWSSSQTAVQVLVGVAGAGIGALNAAREGSGYQAVIWFSGALFLLSTLAVVRVRAAR